MAETPRALLCDQELDAGANIIANHADLVDGLALGIAEGPVVAAEAGDMGALVATAHGDEELCLAREFFAALPRFRAAEVDTYFLRGGEHFRMTGGPGRCRRRWLRLLRDWLAD